MAGTKEKGFYSLGEEIFNSISHGIGAALSIAGFVILVVKAAFSGDGWSIASGLVFGLTLIILYTMSTLYHAITNKTAKKVFRILDHCTIFLLIAGTYTPYTLITLNGVSGWVVFGILWGVTALGIVLNAVSLEKFKKFSLFCYLAMGWAVVFTMKTFIEVLDPIGLAFLFIGGFFYTVGIIFYALKRVKYMHSIWHLFVLAGSIFHYFSILLYVIK
jgi:hemolysin III